MLFFWLLETDCLEGLRFVKQPPFIFVVVFLGAFVCFEKSRASPGLRPGVANVSLLLKRLHVEAEGPLLLMEAHFRSAIDFGHRSASHISETLANAATMILRMLMNDLTFPLSS